MLGQYRHGPGGLADFHPGEGLPIQVHAAPRGLQHPVNALEQGALPAAVGADHAHKAALGRFQIHAFENIHAAQGGLHAFCFDLQFSPPPNP